MSSKPVAIAAGFFVFASPERPDCALVVCDDGVYTKLNLLRSDTKAPVFARPPIDNRNLDPDGSWFK
ncbi:MAG: hypothetical protein AAGD43_01435 [Pseudomonadota bacterium]